MTHPLVPPPLRNIELKARCRDLPAALAAAMKLSPRDAGEQHQIDTYFHVPHGRLKLREIVGIKSELIWYDRSNQAVSRKSDYRLTPITHPAELKASLIAALGIRIEVRKIRRVLLWHNVRIHLDQVERLGCFIEFEAVMTPGEDEPTAHARLAELCLVLAIGPADHMEQSYSDLLLAHQS